MTHRSKKYKAAINGYEDKKYPLAEAIKKAKQTSYSKFPGSIELHFSLTLPKDKEAKSIKGSLTLPYPVSVKETRIIVFCEKDKAESAKKAGAIEAGLEDLVKKVKDGWMAFDVALASPTVMAQIAILGKELGPKGLMPNPKTGTLTDDFDQAIQEFKKGKTKWTCDESGGVHVAVGKIDTDDEKIIANVKTTLQVVAGTIGKSLDQLLKTVTLSPTMGVGVKVETEGLIS